MARAVKCRLWRAVCKCHTRILALRDKGETQYPIRQEALRGSSTNLPCDRTQQAQHTLLHVASSGSVAVGVSRCSHLFNEHRPEISHRPRMAWNGPLQASFERVFPSLACTNICLAEPLQYNKFYGVAHENSSQSNKQFEKFQDYPKISATQPG